MGQFRGVDDGRVNVSRLERGVAAEDLVASGALGEAVEDAGDQHTRPPGAELAMADTRVDLEMASPVDHASFSVQVLRLPELSSQNGPQRKINSIMETHDGGPLDRCSRKLTVFTVPITEASSPPGMGKTTTARDEESPGVGSESEACRPGPEELRVAPRSRSRSGVCERSASRGRAMV